MSAAGIHPGLRGGHGRQRRASADLFAKHNSIPVGQFDGNDHQSGEPLLGHVERPGCGKRLHAIARLLKRLLNCVAPFRNSIYYKDEWTHAIAPDRQHTTLLTIERNSKQDSGQTLCEVRNADAAASHPWFSHRQARPTETGKLAPQLRLCDRARKTRDNPPLHG